MEEKRKYEKAPLIYAIVGVAVLIVAVAGSTFAYFSASATADTPITGETLSIDLGVTIEKVSKEGEKGKGLIPIYDGTVTNPETSSPYSSQLQAAASATKQCVDTHEYTACQVYKITLTNGGKDKTIVDTTIEFDTETIWNEDTETGNYKNLKWVPMSNATTVIENSTVAASTSAVEMFSDVELAGVTGGQEKTEVVKYVMIYVNNTGADQTRDDSGTFNGTIKVTAATGAQVQASF